MARAGKRTKKWVWISDTHGDMQHVPAVRAALSFVNEFKPHHRILGGDAFDLRPLRKGANDDERTQGIEDDMAAGLDLLTKYKPTHYLWGNHEDRIRQWQQSGTRLKQEYAFLLEERIRSSVHKSCVIYPYCKKRGQLKLGNFTFVHGYSAGVYALKEHAMTYGNCVMGHVHSFGVARVARDDAAIGFSSGCLCQLAMDYNRSQLKTLRQDHGFLYGFISPMGKVNVFQAYPVDGQWIFPTEFRTQTNV